MHNGNESVFVLGVGLLVANNTCFLNASIFLIPSANRISRVLHNKEFVSFGSALCIKRLADKERLQFGVVAIFELAETLTAVKYGNLNILFLCFPMETNPRITRNTTHLEYFIGKLKFVRFTPMVHHQLLSLRFKFLINLRSVVTLYVETECLVSEKKHIHLINERPYIIE